MGKIEIKTFAPLTQRKSAKTKPRPNKQRLSRGSSFGRIAKELRVVARRYPRQGEVASMLRAVATALSGEANVLRAMR